MGARELNVAPVTAVRGRHASSHADVTSAECDSRQGDQYDYCDHEDGRVSELDSVAQGLSARVMVERR
jgi:hypothetical protein